MPQNVQPKAKDDQRCATRAKNTKTSNIKPSQTSIPQNQRAQQRIALNKASNAIDQAKLSPKTSDDSTWLIRQKQNSPKQVQPYPD